MAQTATTNKAAKTARTGGDDLDDGLELDPDLLASSDAEEDDIPDRDADIGDEETRADDDDEDEEDVGAEAGEKRKRDDGDEDAPQLDDEERKDEKRRRKKEKFKERKAKVCLDFQATRLRQHGVED